MALHARHLQRSLRLRSDVRPQEGLDSKKPQSRILISFVIGIMLSVDASQL